MYVLHPHSRLACFYAVFVEHQWRLNSENLTCIAQICSNYLPSPPIDLQLATVERYVHEQVTTNQHLTSLVVTELYQKFSTDRHHQIWLNFIHYMSEKLIANLWNRLPEYKRVEETFDLLRSTPLVAPPELFKGFNPEYDRDLLTGIERWTYRFLRNSIFSQIRKREQFFGLSDLGVVSKSTKLSIRKSLSSRVFSHGEGLSNHNLKNRQIVDLLLVDIYKNYLKRSQVRTDKLAVRDWELIELEVQSQWSNLELDLPPPSIAIIQAELKSIGSCIREAVSVSTRSLDATIVPPKGIERKNIDRAGESDWCNVYAQLFTIIKQTILTLEPRNVEILEFRYRDGLIQSAIGLKIGKDQTIVSRRLLAIEKIFLRVIHRQLSHPDDLEITKIDRTAIRAMKQALRAFYSSQQI